MLLMKNKIYLQLSSLTVATFVILGCTSSVPHSELQDLPSLIEIKNINLNNGQLELRVSHRNKETRMNNQLSCQLALKDFPPIKFNEIPLPDLTNYAVETVGINLSSENLPKTKTVNKTLPYVLDCYLFSSNFREERSIKRSTLYPVPGNQAVYR